MRDDRSSRPRDPRRGAVLVREPNWTQDEQQNEIEIELYDDLAPGESAQAYPRYFNGTQLVTDLTADTFEVFDVLERFRGRGRDTTGEDPVHGSYGRAVYRNARWELRYLQPHAQRITCLADGAFVYSDTMVDVDNVVVVKPVKTALLMEEVTQIRNHHEYSGDDNAVIDAFWNDDEELFDMVQPDCEA